jgi:uncharacterized membrane protein
VKRFAAALAVLAAAALGPAASAQEPAVQAVLFFSPTCGHCEYVINELLLPVWFPEHGGEPEWYSGEAEGEQPAFYLATNGSLEVLLVDVGTAAGREFYTATTGVLAIPQERMGVPRLVVGDRYLVGSVEIPQEFPGIIEEGLSSGGIEWPDLPGMEEALAGMTGEPTATTTTVAPTTTSLPEESTTTAPGPTSTAATSTTQAVTTTEAAATPTQVTTTTQGILPVGGDSPWDRFQRDPTANSLALVVLVLMILSLLLVGLAARADEEEDRPPGLAVVLLALAGLGVAVYLAFVEATGSPAVCGPVGNCNAVQQSEWARVLGIPVGIIGVVGYGVVLASWGVACFAVGRLADWARVALFAGAAAGTGFSVYLTFLEPFVIGATCLWCLSSAVIVTALLWLTARPAAAAWERLRAGD